MSDPFVDSDSDSKPKNSAEIPKADARGVVKFKNDKEKETFFRHKMATMKKQEEKPVTSIPQNLDNKFSEEQVLILKKDLRKSDTAAAIVSVIGLILAFVEEELFYDNNFENNTGITILRTVITISCLVLQIFIYRHFNYELKILKAQKLVYAHTNLFKSGLYSRFIVESVLSWIHVPPGVAIIIHNAQLGNAFDVSLNAYICFIMEFRLYMLFRLFDHYTVWTDERAMRVCKINGFTADSKFAIKAYLKYKSFIVLFISLVLSIVVFGFAVRLFERPFSEDFDSVYNCFWNVIVTMTTIGYGDIYVQTHLSRLVIIAACIWGVFILSLFVVTLNNITELSNEEQQAYEEIRKREIQDKKLMTDAKLIIGSFIKLKIMSRNGAPAKDRFMLRMDFISLCSRFKAKRKALLSESKSISDIIEEMQDDEDYGVEELIHLLGPIRSIAGKVSEIQTSQNKINRRVHNALENSKKLYSFIYAANRGEIGKITDLSELNHYYDLNGEKYPAQAPPNAKEELVRRDEPPSSPTKRGGVSPRKKVEFKPE